MITKNNIPVSLIAGRLRGGNSKLENSLLERWLVREGNAALFDTIEKLWIDIKARAGQDEFDETAAWKEIFDAINAMETSDRIHSLRVKFGLAGSVAISALAGLAAVLIIGLVRPGLEHDGEPAVFTSFSSKSSLILPDGSNVMLYPNSKVSYSADFNITERSTELEGRAYYSIAHNTEKPFYIDAGGLKVKVVGTEFDLDARSNEIVLNVTEGKVMLTSDTCQDGLLVPSGSRAIFDKTTGEISVDEADVYASAIWASGKISFCKDKLETVCKGLSDWYGINIIPSDNLKSKGSLSFTVTDESVDVILSIIAMTNGISYRHEGNNTIIIY